MPLIEGRLRRVAACYIHRENLAHTLETSELVNEAYLKLMNQTHVHWQSDTQLLAAAARLMRHVLLDYARRQRSERRGGEAHLEFDGRADFSAEKFDELFALDEALVKLAVLDPLKSRII